MEWTPSTNGPNEAFAYSVTIYSGASTTMHIPPGHEVTVCVTPVDGATAKISGGVFPERPATLLESSEPKMITVEPCGFVTISASGGGDDGAVVADFLVWRAKR